MKHRLQIRPLSKILCKMKGFKIMKKDLNNTDQQKNNTTTNSKNTAFDLLNDAVFFQGHANNLSYICAGSPQISSLAQKDKEFLDILKEVCLNTLNSFVDIQTAVSYIDKRTKETKILIVENFMIPNGVYFIYISAPKEEHFIDIELF